MRWDVGKDSYFALTERRQESLVVTCYPSASSSTWSRPFIERVLFLDFSRRRWPTYERKIPLGTTPASDHDQLAP